jgi:hypothetical protein
LADKSKRIFLLYLGILSVAGGITVYLATSKLGPGVSTDAAMLLSAGENLLKSRALIDYRGVGLTQYPPLGSTIVALGSLAFHQDVFTIGWALNIIVFSALVWLCGVYFYDALGEQPVLAYFASFIVFSSPSLVKISANISSDPLFLLLVVIFLMSMSAYLKSERSRYLVLAVILTVLACLERYAGISLIIAGALTGAYKHRSNIRRAFLFTGAFTILAAAPIFAWGYLHNVPLNGAPFGRHQPAVPALNLLTASEKVLHWFIPLQVIDYAGPLLLLAAILAILLLMLFLTHSTGILQKLHSPQVVPNIAFLLVYSGVLVFDLSYSELKGINTDRVHLILLPSLLVVVFTMVTPLFEAVMSRLGSRWTHGLIIPLFLIWSAYPLAKTYEYVRESMVSGDVSAYNSINKLNARSSPLARYLMSLDLRQIRLYSNGSARAWFILRTQVQPPPSLPSHGRWAYLEQQYAHWPGVGQEAYLVWFNNEGYSATNATPEELSLIANLRQVYTDPEGTVYLVSSR